MIVKIQLLSDEGQVIREIELNPMTACKEVFADGHEIHSHGDVLLGWKYAPILQGAPEPMLMDWQGAEF